LKDASTDPRVIARWFRERPYLNLGVCTGARSFVAIDVDPDKGGADSLYALQRRFGRLPDTVEALTGGGGRHLCFAPPAGRQIRNKQCWAEFPGLDIRGDGGYIVVAPSLHRSGRPYEWEAFSHPDDVPLAPLPDAYLELLTQGLPTIRARRYQPAAHEALRPVGPVLQGCPWLAHTAVDAARLPEGEWYAMLTVLARIEDGRRFAHLWSKPHPKYDPRETEKKFEHARTDTGPATCAAIQSQWGGAKHCAKCIHRGRIVSPVSLGRLADLEMLAPPARKRDLVGA
jgi:hypothetical protein